MKKILNTVKEWALSVWRFVLGLCGYGWTDVTTPSELTSAVGAGKRRIRLAADMEMNEMLTIATNKRLTIDGNGKALSVRGERQGFAYDGQCVVTELKIAKGRIEHEDGSVVAKTEVYPDNVGVYRFKVGAGVALIEQRANYVNFSCGWTAYTFPVTKIEDGYLYFKSQGAEYCLDFDYYQANSKKFTEYRLIGCDSKAYGKYALGLQGGRLKLKDLVVHGGVQNVGGRLTMEWCKVYDCTEFGVNSSDGNVNIAYCEFKNVWKSAVKVRTGKLEMTFNLLKEVNQGRTNYGAIDTDCDAVIYCNRLTNYGSYGIRVGKVNTEKSSECPTVVVSYNSLTQNCKQGVVTDTGAIYVAANNRKTEIIDNTISGYWGRKNNHGIYADDGAYNVYIRRNSISENATGYAISCRCASYDASSSTYRGYGGGTPNTNREITENWCESGIWFGGSAEVKDNGCKCWGNKVENRTEYRSKVENVEIG
jgi:hypothetical protein